MTSFTVRCTHCDTAFPVDPEKVPDGGVRARCTHCEGIFFVSVPDSVGVVEAPEPPDAGLDDAGFASFDDEVEAVQAAAGPGLSVELDDAVDLVESEPGPEEVPAVPAGFQFGKRDPHDKARRLARVLVSDMVTYKPDAHARALERGTLADDFEEEISKSWQEYVDQVGRDIAESTPYWTNALNEVLAQGEDIF